MKGTAAFISIALLMGCSQGADEDKSISLKDKPAPVRSVSYKEQPVTIKPEKKILDVPIIAQNPELKYGCEVTSLAMLLQDAGVKAGKMELAQKVAKDPDPVVKSRNGDIIKWGDPSKGFVGDMTGRHMGYAVYDQPLENLMNEYLPGRTVNLTGQPFDRLLEQIQNGKPVIVWTTGDFRLPDRWESWSHGAKKIRTPLDLHVVVLVGYDADSVYLNDPLSGKKAVKVNKARFIASWKALGERAVSYA